MPSEKRKIEIEKIAYGFKYSNKDVIDYISVKKSIELIQSIELPSISTITSRPINPKRIVKTSKKDLLQLFPNLNTSILYANPEDIDFVQTLDILNNYSIPMILNKLNEIVQPIDMFDIPLYYTQDSHRYGAEGSCSYYLDNPLYLRKMPLTTSFLDLSGPADYITSIICSHEFIHMLLKRFRGIIGNYYHLEVLSIFVEQIIALENDKSEELSRKMWTLRNIYHQESIEVIKNNMDTLDETNLTHLISGLIANCMFARYYNETPIGRKYILGEVQKVLNGEKTFEEFLKEQALDLSTSEVVISTEQVMRRCL